MFNEVKRICIASYGIVGYVGYIYNSMHVVIMVVCYVIMCLLHIMLCSVGVCALLCVFFPWVL